MRYKLDQLVEDVNWFITSTFRFRFKSEVPNTCIFLSWISIVIGRRSEWQTQDSSKRGIQPDLRLAGLLRPIAALTRNTNLKKNNYSDNHHTKSKMRCLRLYFFGENMPLNMQSRYLSVWQRFSLAPVERCSAIGYFCVIKSWR